jgi:hypothetical protein
VKRKDSEMEQCPVCQTEYVRGQVNYCYTCGWDLRLHAFPLTEIPEVLLKQERVRTTWAREWWMRSQAQLWKFQSKLEKTNQEVEFLRVEVAKLQQERMQLMNRLSEFYAHSFEKEKVKVEPTLEGKLTKIETVDLTRLKDLLAQKQWQAADRETAVLLLRVCDRNREGWLRITDLENFPAWDLHNIDRLWTRYSNGHFGFSVQQSLWRKLGGTLDASYEIWCQFCDRVGWYNQGTWIAYESLNFNLDAPPGHLPAAYWEIGLGAERLYYWWWLTPVILFSRFDNCQSL